MDRSDNKLNMVIIDGKPCLVESGTTLGNIIISGHEFSMPCAGRGICGKCRVKAEGELSLPSEEELRHLTAEELKEGIRLACCTKITGSCRIWTEGKKESRICTEGVMPDFKQNLLFSNYGAAVDIGTTTLALCLYDKNGVLTKVSSPNPQGVFGADVISRIEQSLSGKKRELAVCIREAVSNLLREAAKAAEIRLDLIDTLIITGNTVMLYLLTERDTECLAYAPFEANHLFGEFLRAEDLELPCKGAEVYIPKCISAFVGADITAAILASDICRDERPKLLTDIGTNGEIVLWCGEKLFCCSTAAGPAFEGTGLSMGMTGRDGAIDRVDIENGTLKCHVIGESDPEGICGSGVIDAVACLLKKGELDETGLLEDDEAVIGGRVILSQKDIRMVQLAKGAVRAGIETLLSDRKINVGDLAELAIAGGFGSYIRIKNAIEIGLIPDVDINIVTVLGNAALSGAAMILLNKDFIDISDNLAVKACTVDLTASDVFKEKYMESMFFY